MPLRNKFLSAAPHARVITCKRERERERERACRRWWERERKSQREWEWDRKKTSLRDLISLWICGSGTFLKKRFQSILAPTDYNEPGPTHPTPLQSNFLTPTPSMEDMIWYSETMCVYAFVRSVFTAAQEPHYREISPSKLFTCLQNLQFSSKYFWTTIQGYLASEN